MTVQSPAYRKIVLFSTVNFPQNYRSCISMLFLVTLLSGCSAITRITNSAKNQPQKNAYSLATTAQKLKGNNTAILVSFSGGGTRAAALSYGVLEGMRDYELSNQTDDYRLIDQISTISSVSGGSFTAAYYGLYNDAIFDKYKDEFLYRDVSGKLIDIVLSPTFWFSENTRTAAAANYYNQTLFNDATFADMHEESPQIIINSTDLGGGVRFSFLQEYFDLICSDVNDYSIANAVAASSAVPVIFPPVVLQNYESCDNDYDSITDLNMPIHLNSTRKGLVSYADKEERPYIHLVDGGVTDNLGLLAIYDVVKSQQETFQHLDQNIDTVIIISVDASTKPDWIIDDTKSTPAMHDIIGAATDIQLHRYNDLVKSLVVKELQIWQDKSPQRKTYFIDINLTTAKQKEFVNNIPTDFTLQPQQVDALIEHGYQEIINNKQLAEVFKGQNPSQPITSLQAR
ncbi:MAG: patatin-like phospholipase family protein [Psychromonas sp.]